VTPSKNSSAHVGDLVIKMRHGEESHKLPAQWMGIIYKITTGKWGHQVLFVGWSTGAPPLYREEYGIPAAHIYNLPGEYKLIKT